MDNTKIIFDFLNSYHLCSLSTVAGNNFPEVSIVSFSQDENLNIFFQTPNYYRKYENLKNNPNVAIAVGWGLEEMIAVQIEGVASEAKEDEIDSVRQIHITKNPASKPYAHIPENKYFIVKPKWVRYMDLKSYPTKEFVVNF